MMVSQIVLRRARRTQDGVSQGHRGTSAGIEIHPQTAIIRLMGADMEQREFPQGISAGPDLAVRIRREQVRILYANLYNGIIATPLCALLVALLMWRSVPFLPMAIWLMATMAVAAARLLSNLGFNKVRGCDFDHRRWERFFMFGTGAAGILWGASMARGFFPDSMQHQVFLLLIVAGLTAGTTMAYSAIWYGPVLFGLPAMVPFFVNFLNFGDEIHYAMAFATLVFIILNLSITRNNYGTVIRSLRLMFENRELVANLQAAQKQQALDMVELKAAKEQAEAATKMKDEFVAIISHDLRSPLSTIKGLLEYASKADGGMDELQKSGALSRMSDTADNLLAMMDNLLDHHRLRSGKTRLEKRFIGARHLAEIHINVMAHTASKKNVAVKNELPDGMSIFADPILFGQVLHNFLTNALKFTPAGGEIAVFAPSPGKPSIAVRDTGVGIPENLLGSLFKSDVSTTRLGTEGEKGTGLGLPYAFDIMREHGGTMEVESKVGAGSVVTAILPEHQALVLIVDDQPVQRVIMKKMLLSIGKVEVVEAENGKQAVEKLRHIVPDLLITDIQMPEMNGYALMEHIRADAALRPLPILAVSSNAADSYKETRDAVIMAGGDELLAKPLDAISFVRTVQGFIWINQPALFRG